MPLNEIDHFLIDAGKGRFRHDALTVVRFAVGTPHLAALTDHRRHRRVDDDVVRRMKIGNTLGRVDHGQTRTVFLAGVQVADDLVTLGFRQVLDLVVEIDHAVIDVDAQFVEGLAVLLESVLVVDLDAVTENDRMRDLHHRCLDVQREEDAGFAAVFQLGFVEVTQRLLAHEHRVDDLAFEQGKLRLQHGRLAALGDQFHADFTRLVEGQRLFTVVEVTVFHVGNVGLRPLLPFAHRVRALLGVILDGTRRAAVRVAFAQHRIDGGTEALAEAGLERLFLHPY